MTIVLHGPGQLREDALTALSPTTAYGNDNLNDNSTNEPATTTPHNNMYVRSTARVCTHVNLINYDLAGVRRTRRLATIASQGNGNGPGKGTSESAVQRV